MFGSRRVYSIGSICFILFFSAFAAYAQPDGGRGMYPECPNHDASSDNEPLGDPSCSADGGSSTKADPNENKECPAGDCMTEAGDPVDIQRSATVMDVTDVSIPVKHGLSLDARRVYSSKYQQYSSWVGNGALGWSDSGNWRFHTYDMNLWAQETQSYPHAGDPYMMVLATEKGNWKWFGRPGGEAAGEYSGSMEDVSGALGKSLTDPDGTFGGSLPPTGGPPNCFADHVIYHGFGGTIPSGKFLYQIYPLVGTPGAAAYSTWWKQTTSDLVLYRILGERQVTHYNTWEVGAPPESCDEPEEPPCGPPTTYCELWIAYETQAWVLRDNTTGRQYHFNADGQLRYIDANFRNNVPAGTSGHVDDYLELTYISGKTVDTQASVSVLSSVKAPPSDGRILYFNHQTIPTWGTVSVVSSVSLYANGTTHSNLVKYTYLDSSDPDADGKLWRVQRGSMSDAGIQYDYGNLTASSGNANFTFSLSESSKTEYIAMVSTFEYNGSGYTVSPRLANKLTGGTIDQWVADPQDGIWRRAMSVYPQVVQWYDGAKMDNTGRYTGGYFGTPLNMATSDIDTLYSYDISSVNFGGLTSAPPQLRYKYVNVGGATDRPTRLLSKKQLRIGTTGDQWVTLESYGYSNPDSGIKKITSITRYAGYNCPSGVCTEDSSTAQTTTLTYDGPTSITLPYHARVVTHPDGRKDEYTFHYSTSNVSANGRVLTHTVKQTKSTGGTETISTTTYDYYTTESSGALAGLLKTVTTVPAAGPTTVVTYTYSTGSTRKGELIEVKVETKSGSTVLDTEITEFTYDDFGNVLTVETDEDTVTNTYSAASGESDTTKPPRLVKTVQEGRTTRYTYDIHGRLATTVEAHGTGDARTITHGYDKLGNLKTVWPPGGLGPTTYIYSIYGKLIEIKDPSGTSTHYTYDGLGRVLAEWVTATGDTAKLYAIEYAYTTTPSSGCSSCGGSSSQIASRTIKDGDGSPTETLYFRYDLMGRLIGQGTTSAATDVTYSYSTASWAGTRLTEVNHAASTPSELWGTGRLKYEYDYLGRLAREVYPNDRTIEFGYDLAGRLISTKDPFGYVNLVGYDSQGRMSYLTHSTTGGATLTFDDDKLTSITHGNGAKTVYGYGTYDRLQSFDIRNASGTQLLKHDWIYDNLGRKTDIDVTSPYTSHFITVAYDANDRLMNESLGDENDNYTWFRCYDYNDGGNRTHITPTFDGSGNSSRVTGYSTGNREFDTIYGTGGITRSPLGYDFKGNVTSRQPLGPGGDAYTYSWDVYDRMTQVARTGQDTVNYSYDAMGRLLKRKKQSGTTGESTTVNYWMGLNKIAEEKWGGEAGKDDPILRADPETGAVPGDSGWKLVSGAGNRVLEYVNDTVRGRVTHLVTDGGQFDVKAIIGDDWAGTRNSIDAPWNEVNHKHLAFWVKNANVNQEFRVQAYIRTKNTSTMVETDRYIQLRSLAGTDVVNGSFVNFFIGAINAGNWKYVDLDLETRMKALLPNDIILDIDGVEFIGKDLYVDDMIVSGGTMERSYQLIPGAAIGGYLAAQGPGSLGFGQIWHYHYNELGTVVANTGWFGGTVGVYEPDFYGNYPSTNLYGTRPDSLGLTSKFYDDSAGLYYFGYRWLDSERGRWVSEEPNREEGPNLYHLVYNAPSLAFDFTGLGSTPAWAGGGRCCNKSGGVEWALVEGRWVRLRPGKCTSWKQDCDGMTCGGGFYQCKDVVDYGGITCKTPRRDHGHLVPGWGFPGRRWTPNGPKGGKRCVSPTGRGSVEGDTPPGYEYD